MKDDKALARELVEMSRQFLRGYTLIGAVEHVSRMASGLPSGRPEILDLAENAIDRARSAWRPNGPFPRTGQEEIDAAHADGVDLIGNALRLLT